MINLKDFNKFSTFEKVVKLYVNLFYFNYFKLIYTKLKNIIIKSDTIV